MEQPVLHLKRAVYTRWLPHDEAVTSIRRTLNSLLATLERAVAENDDAVAHSLLNAMKTYNFVATLYLLSDVLPILTTLSLVFQRESVLLTAILPNVPTASLNLLKSQPGLHLQTLNDVLADLSSQFGITLNESDKKSFQENVREWYIDALVGNKKKSFFHYCPGLPSSVSSVSGIPKNSSYVQSIPGCPQTSYGTLCAHQVVPCPLTLTYPGMSPDILWYLVCSPSCPMSAYPHSMSQDVRRHPMVPGVLTKLSHVCLSSLFVPGCP